MGALPTQSQQPPNYIAATWTAIKAIFKWFWLRTFGVRYLLKESRAQYCKTILLCAKYGRMNADDVKRNLERLSAEASKEGFSPDVVWILELELIQSQIFDADLLDMRIHDQIANLRSFGVEGTVWIDRHKTTHAEKEKKQHLLIELNQALFVAYETRITIEKLRSMLLYTTAILSVCGLVILLGLYWKEDQRVIYLLCMCGLCGAGLSIYQRLTKLRDFTLDGKSLVSLLHSPEGMFVSLLFGTVCPILGALLVCSGVIRSSFLPKVDSMESVVQPYGIYVTNYTTTSIAEFTHHAKELLHLGTNGNYQLTVADFMDEPADTFEHLSNLHVHRNVAKLLLLGLLCGFSERLIHDAIDNFMKRFSKEQSHESPDHPVS